MIRLTSRMPFYKPKSINVCLSVGRDDEGVLERLVYDIAHRFIGTASKEALAF